MIYLVVTVDVEPDCTPTWHYSSPLTFDGVATGIRTILQPLFNKHGVAPTYLVNNVVLEHEPSVDVLRSLHGRHELGTHLHGEFIEPKKVYYSYAGKKAEANQCALPPEIELEKLRTLTNLFDARFGRSPTSFRAGRFSAGSNTIRSLRRLGYKVDTSVTPHICWNDVSRERSVDFSSAPEQPYFVSESELLHEDSSRSVLEVPVSIGVLRRLFRRKDTWLRPHFSSLEEMKKLSNHFVRKYASQDIIVLNMMFHNVEVIPQKNPYTKTRDDCRQYIASIDEYLLFVTTNAIQSVTLSELYDLYNAA